MAVFALVLALGVAFFSKGEKTSILRSERQLPIRPIEIKSELTRVESTPIKVHNLKREKSEDEISLNDLRIIDLRNGIQPSLIQEAPKETSKSVEFRLRPSEDFYWKFLENSFDLESALKDINFKKPPLKGEIKINF
jgi:hypothetical protein